MTDAAWGNALEGLWIEGSEEDYWNETETQWIRHNVQDRRTSFHPGAAQGGPDLHSLSPERQTEMLNCNGSGLRIEMIDD